MPADFAAILRNAEGLRPVSGPAAAAPAAGPVMLRINKSRHAGRQPVMSLRLHPVVLASLGGTWPDEVELTWSQAERVLFVWPAAQGLPMRPVFSPARKGFSDARIVKFDQLRGVTQAPGWSGPAERWGGVVHKSRAGLAVELPYALFKPRAGQ